MGQQLVGRPISQQQGFATLNGASNPMAPNQQQFRGFTSPAQPAHPTVGPYAQFRRPPITLGGFRGYTPVSGIRLGMGQK